MTERGWYTDFIPVPSGGPSRGYAGGAARLSAVMYAGGGSGAVAQSSWRMDKGVRRSAGVCSLGPRLVASMRSAGVCSLGPRLVAPRG